MRPFPQQEAIMTVWRPRWHVGGCKHYATCKWLQEFALLRHFCYCFITRLPSSTPAWAPWKPPSVTYRVAFTVTCVVAIYSRFPRSQFTSCASRVKKFELFLSVKSRMFKSRDSVLLLTTVASFWKPDFLFFFPSLLSCKFTQAAWKVQIYLSKNNPIWWYYFINFFMQMKGPQWILGCRAVFHLTCKKCSQERVSFFQVCLGARVLTL